jgi:hypothetical protein
MPALPLAFAIGYLLPAFTGAQAVQDNHDDDDDVTEEFSDSLGLARFQRKKIVALV